MTSPEGDGAAAYVQPPTVFSVQPGAGPQGTPVTLLGTGFTGAYDVAFGPMNTSPIVGGDTMITVVAPPGGEGTVTVTVTTPAGTSYGGGAAQFTYLN